MWPGRLCGRIGVKAKRRVNLLKSLIYVDAHVMHIALHAGCIRAGPDLWLTARCQADSPPARSGMSNAAKP